MESDIVASELKISLNIIYDDKEPLSIGFDFTSNLQNGTFNENYVRQIMDMLSESVIRKLIQDSVLNESNSNLSHFLQSASTAS